MGELILLAVIGLVFIGPKDLPVVARMIGRLLNEFKRASGDLTNVLLDARDQTNQTLHQAREEYNKALEKAAIPDINLNATQASQSQAVVPNSVSPLAPTSPLASSQVVPPSSGAEIPPGKKDV